MPLQEYPSLTVDVDFGGGGTTGTFELYGGEARRDSVDEGVENPFPVDNGLDNLLGLVKGLSENGESGRKGVHVDVGGGQHVFRVQVTLPEGGMKDDDTPIQWGSSNTVDDPPTATSATGAHPIAQQNVLNRYFTVGSPDSLQPATLEWGLYTDDTDTPYDPLNVVVKNLSASVAAGTPQLEVSMTIAETVDGREAVDAAERTKRGAF